MVEPHVNEDDIALDVSTTEPIDDRYLSPSGHRDSKFKIQVQSRQRTPDLAVQGFDGHFNTVRAREVKTRCCTRAVMNFVLTAIVLGSMLATCVILLVVNGFDAPGADWLMGIAGLCLGVFLPSPKVNKQK